jgi:hypothetical protein
MILIGHPFFIAFNYGVNLKHDHIPFICVAILTGTFLGRQVIREQCRHVGRRKNLPPVVQKPDDFSTFSNVLKAFYFRHGGKIKSWHNPKARLKSAC